MVFAPELTVLGYIVRGDRVLLCHRNARPDDQQLGKWNGLGGKVERDEDALAALVREVREESGLTVTAATLRGTVSWPGFGRAGEDVYGLIWLITGFEGEPPATNVEGELSWQPIATMMELPMWEGDRHFLPLVFDDDPRVFHACLPYRDGRPVGWSCTRL